MIGYVSQLTHAIAVSLMNANDNTHLAEYTGDSFRDLTRIAKINENLWSELFFLNKENLIAEIDQFSASLEGLKRALVENDETELKRLFVQSTARRRLFDKNGRRAEMKLEQMPRYPLLCGFTPLQRMENLEQALGCGPLYIKRDDLTPLGLGGNKTRKLEFLLGDALAGGADTLVTVGGVQTNHGRLTAAAAAKAGLACTLVLDGARPEKLSGNLLLDCLLGASLVYTDGRSTSAVIEETLAALQAAGRAPYFIPEGGSNAVGSAGYLAMVPELLAQADSLPVPPRGWCAPWAAWGRSRGCGWEPEPSARRFRHGRGGEPHNRIHEGKGRGAGE